MTDLTRPGVARRDILAAGVALAGLGGTGAALAQTPAAPPTPAPSSGPVVLERLPGGILSIGINRPAAQNRIDPPTLLGLGKAYYQLDHDDALRVGVLHAYGPAFVQGLDVPAFTSALRDGVVPFKDPEYINPAGVVLPHRLKPVVVAVHGQTRTVGHELFLAADVRVAASDTVFAQNEVVAAIFPLGGATVRFTREAGWGNAMRYMLSGEEWGAEEAYRLGLVQAVTPPGQQLARALEFARKIAAAAPLGVRATLASAHQAQAGEDAVFATLQPEGARLRQSADYQEFQRAQQEKRTPVYQGR
jgi:enoyl-CoA hydratase/carnithine racemase